MLHVDFNVIGLPRPQGSKRAFVRAGRAHLVESAGAALADWRGVVAGQAAAQRERIGRALDGPLVLMVVFRLPMPASRPASRRAHGTAWHDRTPDLDKLLRALGDSLTHGGLIADDARIVHVLASKVETTDWTGARVVVGEIANTPDTLRQYLDGAL